MSWGFKEKQKDVISKSKGYNWSEFGYDAAIGFLKLRIDRFIEGQHPYPCLAGGREGLLIILLFSTSFMISLSKI